MRLTCKRYVIEIGKSMIELRPSLRAAYLLETEHGGLHKIAKGVASGHLGMIGAVLRAASDRPQDAVYVEWLGEGSRGGLKLMLEKIVPVLMDLLASYFDADAAPAKKAKRKAKPDDTLKHFERLFEIGAGWMNWSAEDTWQATPAEIMSAQKGRADMLRAIFGSKKETGEGSEGQQEPDFTRDRDATSKLRALSCR
jgi:hypothetical protein